MAATDNKETIQTGDPGTIKAACDAMHDGRDVTLRCAGMFFTGQVMTIRRLDDMQFQITLRLAA